MHRYTSEYCFMPSDKLSRITIYPIPGNVFKVFRSKFIQIRT